MTLIQKNLAYLIFPLVACFLSLVLTRLCITILPFLGLVDTPGGRHIHKKITPKGGGLAIIVAFAVTWLIFLFSPWKYFIGNMSLGFMGKASVPGVMLILLGLIDDKFAIRARYKLLGQIIVGITCCYFGIRFSNVFHYQLPIVLSYTFTTIWIVGFVNAFNLIDGLDGLAAGLAMVSSICMASIFVFEHLPLNTVIILCLAGACFGFLRYNFHPARIFMGDTGSMFLGFMLAVTGIVSSTKIATFSAVLIPLLAAGVPVFDVFLAIWRRLSRRLLRQQESNGHIASRETFDPSASTEKIMDADKEHLHHRLFDRNHSQAKTTLFMYIIAIVLGVLAVGLVVLKDKVQGLAFIIMLGTFVAAIRYLATVELWNSTKIIINGIHRPKRSVLISLSHPFLDVIFLVGSFIVTYYLFHDFLYSSRSITNMLLLTFYNILPVVIILHLGFVYRRYWLRSSSSDYIKLAELLVIGHVINVVIQYFLYYRGQAGCKYFIAQYLIFLLLSSALIIGERMFLRYFRSNFLKNVYLKHNQIKNIPRAVIYGGGLRCRYFLTERFSYIEDDPIDIIGIIDDQPALRNQFVYGLKVLGNINELEEIYQKKPFRRLIISSPRIDQDKKLKVREFCQKYNIKLTELVFGEKDL